MKSMAHSQGRKFLVVVKQIYAFRSESAVGLDTKTQRSAFAFHAGGEPRYFAWGQIQEMGWLVVLNVATSENLILSPSPLACFVSVASRKFPIQPR